MKKTWDLKRAVKRLSYRLNKREGKFISFKPNYDDKDALVCMVEYIDRVNEQSLVKNDLFAKLFVYVLRETIISYDSVVLDKEIQLAVSHILDNSLEYQIQSFIREFKTNQIEKIAELSKKKEITKEHLNRIYTDDVIRGYLNEMITNALNRF